MQELHREIFPTFKRTLLPIEQDCKLGAAIIGQRTIRTTHLARSALDNKVKRIQPQKIMKQVENMESEVG